MVKAEFLINYKGEPSSLDTLLSVFDIYQLNVDNPMDNCCILYPISGKANPDSPIFKVCKDCVNAVLNHKGSVKYNELQDLIGDPIDKTKIKKIEKDQIPLDIKTALFDYFSAIL